MSDFSLESVLSGELTEPTLAMRLPDAAGTCRQAMHTLKQLSVEEVQRLSQFASRALLMYERQKNTLQFPGGVVTLESDRVERKLAEFMQAGGRSCRVTYISREWNCWLHVDVGRTQSFNARSRVGLLDAIANALMVYEHEKAEAV